MGIRGVTVTNNFCLDRKRVKELVFILANRLDFDCLRVLATKGTIYGLTRAVPGSTAEAADDCPETGGAGAIDFHCLNLDSFGFRSGN
jgi:hypothetical protein